MNSASLVFAGGLYSLVFAVFHLGFWRLFDWPQDLRSLTFINRAVMQVLNLSLTFAFIVFAVPSLAYPDQMVSTNLGRTLLLLISAFWLLRAVEQVVFFGLRRGVSVAFFAVFLLGTALYGIPWIRGLRADI